MKTIQVYINGEWKDVFKIGYGDIKDVRIIEQEPTEEVKPINNKKIDEIEYSSKYGELTMIALIVIKLNEIIEYINSNNKWTILLNN